MEKFLKIAFGPAMILLCDAVRAGFSVLSLLFATAVSAQFENTIVVDGISYTIYDTTYALFDGSGNTKVIMYLQSEGVEQESGLTRGYYLTNGELYCRGEMQKGFYLLYNTWYPNGKKGPVYAFDRQGMISGVWPDTLIGGSNYSVYSYWTTAEESSLTIYIESSGHDAGTGDVVGVYTNGKLYCTATMRNHYLCGYFESFHPDGSLHSRGSFHEEGIEDRQEQEIYHALGNPGVSSMRVGWWEWYYPNGVMMAAGEYNERGLKTGTWKWYYDNTQLRAELSFSNFSFYHVSLQRIYNAVPEKYTEYYANEQPKIVMHFNVEEILRYGYTPTEAFLTRKTWYANGMPCDDESTSPYEFKSWCPDGTLYYFERESDSAYFYDETVSYEKCSVDAEPFIPILYEYYERPPFRDQPKCKF